MLNSSVDSAERLCDKSFMGVGKADIRFPLWFTLMQVMSLRTETEQCYKRNKIKKFTSFIDECIYDQNSFDF